MPWDLRVSESNVEREGLSVLTRAQIEFNASRARVAVPCYVQLECLSWEPYGGLKLESSPLKTMGSSERIERVVGSCSRIGVDVPYLSIKNPATQVCWTVLTPTAFS